MAEIVDLSKLSPPKVIEEIDYEKLLKERKDSLITRFPIEEQETWRKRLELESHPITKLLEENAYLEILIRQRINEAAQATMLAYATGTDLDVLAGNYNITRWTINPADETKTPPIPAVMESDKDLRMRCQLAFEGLSVAGPKQAYRFHALSAHPTVADIAVRSPKPAYVDIFVLSRTGTGVASEEEITAVSLKLNDDNIRPVADRVEVKTAEIVTYQITATIFVEKKPEIEPIKKQTNENIQRYIHSDKRLGRDITRSAIFSCLHVEGVQNVKIIEPAEDLILKLEQAGFCTAVNLTYEKADSDE